MISDLMRRVLCNCLFFNFFFCQYMCNDTYTSPTGKMLDEKRKKGTVKEYPSPFSQLYPISGFFWASQHPLFSHIHLPQAEVPSSLLQTPVPPCSCYSRVQKERVYPQLLSAPGLWQHFLTFRICSCVSSERPLHFFSVKALAKLDTSILCLFTGQVQDRQQQSEVSHAALHSTDLCNDPNFYWG